MKVQKLFEVNRYTPGVGCFTCRVCKKKTREVNNVNAEIEMCSFCYAKETLQNELLNKQISKQEFEKQLIQLKKKYNK